MVLKMMSCVSVASNPSSNSLPGAVWIQCSNCQWWAHAICVKEEINRLFYKCLYCNDSIVPLDEDSDLSEI